MRRILEVAVSMAVAAHETAVPILERFNGVYIQDSTAITLPDALVDIWHGSGENRTNETVAGLKVQVQFDYSTGRLSQIVLQNGRAQDRDAPIQSKPATSFNAVWHGAAASTNAGLRPIPTSC